MAVQSKPSGPATLQRRRFRPIETFEESIEAHKLISRLVYEGGTDDFGPSAEIIPVEFEIDARGSRTAVVFIIRAPREFVDRVVEGVSMHAGIRRELVKPGSNVAVLRPRDDAKFTLPPEMVEEKFSLVV